MGEVYLAEQAGPIHRRVALKIIKLGMDTNQTLARFETEREALALMNHPGVAKIFDAGTTEQGRSYFVMEHVPGIPITEYSDKHRLTTEERLRLFIDVCHAIQHAHQKGIIHRDIKPSNVLVTIQDNKHLPKVIDFGVAKATQHRLAGRTSFTEHGQLIGTPGYISPEQAEMTALDIDTRTDIYSLGVLLYELLVGARPFDEAFLHRAGFAEMKRVLREVDPPKPSTRLSSLGDQSTNIAHRRHTNPEDLAQFVRGDLDWITMKCLEKNRTCRYETVNDLRLDVERFLKHEPVLAGPPGGVYRIRKFVRRNRLAVSAVALVVVVLVAGLAGTSYGLAQAIRARHAEVSLRNIAEIRVAEASKARDEAVAWVQCLADLVASLYTEFLNFDLSETPYTVRAEACLFDRLPALIDVLLAEGDFAKVETILIHSYESVQSDTDAEQRKRVTVEGLINRICLPPFL